MNASCRSAMSVLLLHNRNILTSSYSRCVLIGGVNYSTKPRSKRGENIRNLRLGVHSHPPALHSLEYSTNKRPPSQHLDKTVIGKHVELHRNPENRNTKSLALMFPWLLSRKQHIMKYANFYFRQGMDVLTVRITPWQLLWPVAGSQVTADTVINYLYKEQNYENILFHGFSVGAYLFGECLNKLMKSPKVYDNISSRVVGQVYDSAVDFQGIPVGIPRAFTKNPILQKSIEAYIRYHLKTFTNSATVHYIRSSESFHHCPLPCPTLGFFSKDDPVGTPEGNMSVFTKWEAKGVPVYIKCFESSPHVSHFHKHPKEYKAELAAFMDMVGLLQYPDRVPEFDGKLRAYQLRSSA